MTFTPDQIRHAMRLYGVTDQMWLKEGETLCSVCAEVLSSGVTFLQIREKDISPDAFTQQAKALKALCNAHQVPFVVNDSVEIALEIGADGVHVGQSDLQGRDIRRLIGSDKILGITAGTVAQAIAAQAAGADYIGVGAVFATTTKQNARNLTGDTLRQIAQSVTIPVVAIGGINAQNIMELAGSGVDGVAVVSAIFAAENPRQATAHLRQLADTMVTHG